MVWTWIEITLNFFCNLDFENLFEIYFEFFKFEFDFDIISCLLAFDLVENFIFGFKLKFFEV